MQYFILVKGSRLTSILNITSTLSRSRTDFYQLYTIKYSETEQKRFTVVKLNSIEMEQQIDTELEDRHLHCCVKCNNRNSELYILSSYTTEKLVPK